MPVSFSLRVLIAATIAGMALHVNTSTMHAQSRENGAGAGNAGGVAMGIVGARIWTADPARPWATALAVSGERITAVGSDAEIRAVLPRGARVLDARGAMVVPGFIDSHVHFLSGGFQLTSVQLRNARTPAEFIRRLADFARTQPPGAWIQGGDWDHQNWGGELPDRRWIDSVTPRNPVFVSRLDGHMALANSEALRLAGVSAATSDVPGGTIVRDAGGAPTGILKDNAQELVTRVVPEPSGAASDRALDAAMRYVAERGVVAVVHMGTWGDLSVFERAHREGRLSTRIYAAVPLSTWERLRDTVMSRGRGDDWLGIGALKGFVDGSLGSHTAAMLAPFSDAPGDTGLFVSTPEELYRWTSGADRAGLHVMVHAIGDRANRLQLDIFERVARENPAHDRRFRIEHAQHLAPVDIPRFARLRVIASMQPYHAIDDGRWAESVIGYRRARTTYAFRSLLDAGARLAFGSDWSVAPPTPLEGIYAAVARRTLDGKHPDGWIPGERITVEEALRAYTIDAAYAAFADQKRGSLVPGKLADLVILDRDITRVPPDSIRDARVLLTMVGGRVVYESGR